MSTFSAFKVPKVANEPMANYAKGSLQRKGLTAAVESLQKKGGLEVPLVIGGNEIKTSSTQTQVNPADHKTTIATYSLAGPQDVRNAIEAALAAKPEWESLPFADRAAVFLKAADLVSNKYRYDLMAATILGQGKNAWQAEIDAAAELCDFFRFNVQYAEELYAQQPVHNSAGVWNRVEYRPLEGFIYAVSPFNFTAIAGNLPGVPALMGNVVVWKPSDYAIASNWLLYNILIEAGLPKNVIQFVPGNPEEVTKEVLAHRKFAALHYTGSTGVFRKLYGDIGAGVAEGRYQCYPRIVGETGGKNFHLIHPSADIENAVLHTVRGAFEYQGQKCSATSRLYVPSSIWPQFKARLVEETEKLTVGNPVDHQNFVGPVIHAASFKKLSGAIDEANKDEDVELLTGGSYDDSQGFYVKPTIYQSPDPRHKLFSTELFGPVLAVYVYDDSKDPVGAFASACDLVDSTSDYGLTGSVFAADRAAVRFAEEKLRNSAGNFYINCKNTGAVVGQQPFGGSRASGTNDKAGSINILGRFVSMRSIKEEFNAMTRVQYPITGDELSWSTCTTSTSLAGTFTVNCLRGCASDFCLCLLPFASSPSKPASPLHASFSVRTVLHVSLRVVIDAPVQTHKHSAPFYNSASVLAYLPMTVEMPRTALPPTPASSTDMKGQDGSKLASLQMSFELPPPATIPSDGASGPASSSGAPDLPSHASETGYPMQASETVKSRRRVLASTQAPPKDKGQFALPPPPTRSRKIIQMKPREEPAQPARSSNARAASASKASTPPPTTAGTKRKQPSATSAAGRKIARKTAHSLIERRRRSKMNEEFAVLKGMIPACTGEMHKLAILQVRPCVLILRQASIEYVKYLEDCVSQLKAQRGPDAESRTNEMSGGGLPSPTGYNPDRRYTRHAEEDADSLDVEMTSNTSSEMPSPAVTHRASADRSQQPSISPALLSQEDSRNRHNSYSSVSTTEYRHNMYAGGSSAATSPAFGPQQQQHHHHHHRYAQSSTHSASGSALTSPALAPQRDFDEEATTALLMLNQSDRRGSSSTSGRGMSVRDLLST
ncbi:delta-1-pyrroline-5-carboxylate dehydrogenase-like protein [Apodospora peruviana]|uniref:L-glutamate gamma-semialdehyde dehydrogenase n=1 Tax=Apodospora peruviana TaxID=516989 RepID=A0AAE0ITC1_9PEZI|nr:delta-1-pyrroline-5-carboxylate dehydrogenase-like protein [Apodospora peruviana]